MDILKNIQFLKLWGNQVLLQIAFNMSNFTAILLLNEITGSRTALAQFYAAMTLPAFLVGFFAGSIVDTTNRKRLMLITDALLAILFLGYAVFGTVHYAVLAIAFLAGSVAQFFTPAEAATIPLIVKGEQLEKANALFLFTGLGAVVLGYALAGPVIQFFGGLEKNGAQAAFVVASILTGIGFFLRLSLKTIERPLPEVINQQIFMRTLVLTKEVIFEARTNNKISLSIILLTLMEFNIGMLAIIFIDYVEEYLNLPATSTSYFLVLPLIAGLGIGLAVMGTLQRWWGRGKSIFLGTLAFGLVILSLGISGKAFTGESFGPMLLRLFTIIGSSIIGVAAVFIAVHARTVLQENTPHVMLGRVFSLVTISISAIAPIPILIISLATEKLDVTTIFIGFGIFLTLLALLLAPLVSKKLN